VDYQYDTLVSTKDAWIEVKKREKKKRKNTKGGKKVK